MAGEWQNRREGATVNVTDTALEQRARIAPGVRMQPVETRVVGGVLEALNPLKNVWETVSENISPLRITSNGRQILEVTPDQVRSFLRLSVSA